MHHHDRRDDGQHFACCTYRQRGIVNIDIPDRLNQIGERGRQSKQRGAEHMQSR